MLNLRRVVGIIAIIAVAGFMFIGCEDSILNEFTPNFPKNLQGTWVGDNDNGTLIIKKDSVEGDKGGASDFAGQINLYIAAGVSGALGLGPKVTFTITETRIAIKMEKAIAGTDGQLDVIYPYTISGKVLTIKDTDDKIWFTGEKQ